MKPIMYNILLCFAWLGFTGWAGAEDGPVPEQEPRSLFTPEPTGVAALLKNRSSVAATDVSAGSLDVLFEAGGYPNVGFPCPEKGWDLSYYRGIAVEVTNRETYPVRVALRIDNPGSAADQFWNTETLQLAPGESGVLRSVFGRNNGKPGYPIDPEQITAYQVFLINPGQDTTLRLGSPFAYGSPEDFQRRPRLSAPADRGHPVTPPSWLGNRPPVDGEWMLTLEETFSEHILDRSRWTTRDPVHWPHPRSTHRYLDENVSIREGMLVIRAEENPGTQYNLKSDTRREFATGMVNGYDLSAFRYGYIEIRTKFPSASGLEAVVELIPDRGGESGLNMHERRTSHDLHGQGMEMDLFHHLTEWGPGRLGVSTRWGGPAGTHDPQNWGNGYVYHGPTPDGWHHIGLLWEPDRLAWYVDGELKESWSHAAIANVPSYLSLALRSGMKGSRVVEKSGLPDEWLIDSVKVWRRAGPDTKDVTP